MDIDMKTEKLRIGYFCPFVYPSLIKHENVEIVEIKRTKSATRYLGNIRLCSKLTAVYCMLEEEKLDGLLMSNCCNLSMGMDGYIDKIYNNIPKYTVKIPRKVDSKFYENMQKQWKDVQQWINGISLNRNIKTLEQTKKDNNSEVDEEQIWCTIPLVLKDKLHLMNTKEAIDTLIKNIYCPRLIDGSDCEPPCEVQSQHITQLVKNMERECVLQNYYVSMLKDKVKI